MKVEFSPIYKSGTINQNEIAKIQSAKNKSKRWIASKKNWKFIDKTVLKLQTELNN